MFVVAAGPDRSPQPMETVDRLFTMVPLLTPRGPSRTQQSAALPRLRRLLFFLPLGLSSLVSHRFPCLFFLLHFSCSNAEGQMICEASSFCSGQEIA